MYLISIINEVGKTTHLPIVEWLISPLLTTSCQSLRILEQIIFLLALIKDNLWTSIVV